MPPVEERVPIDPGKAQGLSEDAERRVEDEQPQHAGDGGRDRIRPDQQRLEGLAGAQVLVGLRREEKRAGERQGGDEAREYERRRHGGVVFGLGEERAVVLEADELARQPERVLQKEGLPHGLARRPVEEHDRDRELRHQQRVGQKP